MGGPPGRIDLLDSFSQTGYVIEGKEALIVRVLVIKFLT